MQYSIDFVLNQIIKPSLTFLDLATADLETFLAAAAYCQQPIEGGYGVYQISHSQHWDLWDHYLVNHPLLASKVRGLASQHRFLENPDLELTMNHGYATAIAALLMFKLMGKRPDDTLTFEQMYRAWQIIAPQTPRRALKKRCHQVDILQLHRVA
ncbi:hypothetical protein [Reinekea sp. G2M2-21]|uniref:hypothetical protein n=1 Tax=Reinekea sp. G2M2-21 TaxID=2788942 RepID=UPI0018AB48CF|nr:hypothetical protein [Reinekea sp. G2M2-21]